MLVVARVVRSSRGWTSVFGAGVQVGWRGEVGDTASLCKGDGQLGDPGIVGWAERWSHSGHLAEELFLRDRVRQSLTDVPLY